MKIFSKRFKKLRLEKGLSQEETARELQVTKATIIKWENEKTLPALKKAIMISNLFNVKLNYLFGLDVMKSK